MVRLGYVGDGGHVGEGDGTGSRAILMGRTLREDGISMDAARAEAMREVDCGRLRRTSGSEAGF